jgi:hypothetical protein
VALVLFGGLAVAIVSRPAEPLAAYTLLIAALGLALQLSRRFEEAPNLQVSVEATVDRRGTPLGIAVRAWSAGGPIAIRSAGFGMDGDNRVPDFDAWHPMGRPSGRSAFAGTVRRGEAAVERWARFGDVRLRADVRDSERIPSHVFVEDVERKRKWEPIPENLRDQIKAASPTRVAVH